eukprot:scaffold200624_cov18-Tisochrysis_lutea.AAC.2
MSNSHFDNTCEHTITHRCAEFFMSNGHYDKAVKMTVAAGRHTQALELAVQHEAVDPGKGAVEMSVAGGRNTQALDSQQRLLASSDHTLGPGAGCAV